MLKSVGFGFLLVLIFLLLLVGVGLSAIFGGFGNFIPNASFSVRGTSALMQGVITSQTPKDVAELIINYPDVDTIVMYDVPGSLDDTANLRASRLIREAGFNTHVPSFGFIASGGVDFFASGVQRSADQGARFGVHAWAGFAEPGTEGLEPKDLPRDHTEHQKYLSYYSEMGIPEEFYWFTLNAAPADDLYIMQYDELIQFGLVNKY